MGASFHQGSLGLPSRRRARHKCHAQCTHCLCNAPSLDFCLLCSTCMLEQRQAKNNIATNAALANQMPPFPNKGLSTKEDASSACWLPALKSTNTDHWLRAGTSTCLPFFFPPHSTLSSFLNRLPSCWHLGLSRSASAAWTASGFHPLQGASAGASCSTAWLIQELNLHHTGQRGGMKAGEG